MLVGVKFYRSAIVLYFAESNFCNCKRLGLVAGFLRFLRSRISLKYNISVYFINVHLIDKWNNSDRDVKHGDSLSQIH